MSDNYTPQERAAIAAALAAGKLQRIPTRTPEEWLAEPAGPMRGSVWGHDGGGNAIHRAQKATGRRLAREKRFAAAKRKKKRTAPKPAPSKAERTARQAAKREAELRTLVAEGRTTAEIADRWGICPSAVRTFASRRGVSMSRRRKREGKA